MIMSQHKFRINYFTAGLIFILGYIVLDVLKNWDSFMAGLFLLKPVF